MYTGHVAALERGVINRPGIHGADLVPEDMVVDGLIPAVQCQVADVILVLETTLNLRDAWVSLA